MFEQLDLFRFLPGHRAPATATHRHIVLAGRLVDYALRRDRRRLTLRIDERGLHVGAPRSLPLATIEAFILQHGRWVVDKLDAHTQTAAPRHLAIRDGTQFPLLGRTATVRVVAGANRGCWEDDTLWLAARPQADLARLAQRALQRRALEDFAPRLQATTRRLGVAAPPLALSSARTRWGSCSAKSGIRLNWRLIHLPEMLVDYVIAHEAAHLVEMNHSTRFWNVVSRVCPDWASARQELRRQGAALPLI